MVKGRTQRPLVGSDATRANALVPSRCFSSALTLPPLARDEAKNRRCVDERAPVEVNASRCYANRSQARPTLCVSRGSRARQASSSRGAGSKTIGIQESTRNSLSQKGLVQGLRKSVPLTNRLHHPTQKPKSTSAPRGKSGVSRRQLFSTTRQLNHG